jgi:hypothetical protein
VTGTDATNKSPRRMRSAIAGPHDYDQILALVERGKLRVKDTTAISMIASRTFLSWRAINSRLRTTIVTVDFATTAIRLPVPGSRERQSAGRIPFRSLQHGGEAEGLSS